MKFQKLDRDTINMRAAMDKIQDKKVKTVMHFAAQF